MWKACLVASLLFVSRTITTSAAEIWIGQRVFAKDGATARAGVKEGDPQVDLDLIPWPAKVEDENGDFLWIGRAWLHRSEVTTIDQALDYYSDQIRSSATASAFCHRGCVWLAKGGIL